MDANKRRERRNATARQRHAKDPEKRRAYCREWWDKNPIKRRNYWYQKSYGISYEQYLELQTIQGNKCATCLQPEKHYKTLCLDHDHLTGRIRGLLCHKCNSALGMVDEKIPVLEALIRYLKGVENAGQ